MRAVETRSSSCNAAIPDGSERNQPTRDIRPRPKTHTRRLGSVRPVTSTFRPATLLVGVAALGVVRAKAFAAEGRMRFVRRRQWRFVWNCVASKTVCEGRFSVALSVTSNRFTEGLAASPAKGEVTEIRRQVDDLSSIGLCREQPSKAVAEMGSRAAAPRRVRVTRGALSICLGPGPSLWDADPD